jgi:hypothetical protein
MFVMLDINIPPRSINIFQQDATAVVLSIGLSALDSRIFSQESMKL